LICHLLIEIRRGIQVLIQFRLRSIPHQCISASNIKVNIWGSKRNVYSNEMRKHS
jgi:hypothetical protein